MNIATCIATDGRTNFPIRTTPGRVVQFRNCQAKVVTEKDMPRLLQEPGVVITIDPGYIDWITEWIRSIPGVDPIKATLLLPPGISFGENYEIVRAAVEAPVPLPVTPEPIVGKRKPKGEGW